MKKVLLYGNCQLSILGNFLFRPDVQVLDPQHYGIEIDHFWQRFVFFPKNAAKGEGLNKALQDCDYFIFQHIHHPKFISSKELYDNCKAVKLCLTNFRLTLNEPEINLEEIEELKRRACIHKDNYGEDIIDLSDWIDTKHQRWGESYQLTHNHPCHPSGLYYNKLSREVIKKLNLDLEPLDKDFLYHGSR